MYWIFIALALLAGACLPLQAGVNAQLNRYMGDVLLTTGVSIMVSSLTLVVLLLATRASLPPLAQLGQTQWWHWTGGLMGLFLVIVCILAAPRLGATRMVALIVAGQMIFSLAMDQWGLAGYAVREISVSRLAGAALLVAGVVLVNR